MNLERQDRETDPSFSSRRRQSTAMSVCEGPFIGPASTLAAYHQFIPVPAPGTGKSTGSGNRRPDHSGITQQSSRRNFNVLNSVMHAGNAAGSQARANPFDKGLAGPIGDDRHFLALRPLAPASVERRCASLLTTSTMNQLIDCQTAVQVRNHTQTHRERYRGRFAIASNAAIHGTQSTACRAPATRCS